MRGELNLLSYSNIPLIHGNFLKLHILVSTVDLESFVSTHVIITRFDDTFGPQVMLTYPQMLREKQNTVIPILKGLLDLQMNSTDWQFMYADQTFASQNIIFTNAKKHQDDTRDAFLEYGISVVLLPANEIVVQELYGIWTYLSILKEVCIPFLYDIVYSNLPVKAIIEELDLVVNELNNQFNNS